MKRWSSADGSAEGATRVEGTREGEWFERWEGTIRRAVAEGRIDRVPMREPSVGSEASEVPGGFMRRLV